MAHRLFSSRIMDLDCDDQFRSSCRTSRNYPCNLLRTRHPASALQRWNQKLVKESIHLFDDEESRLNFLEVYNGVGTIPTVIDDEFGLETHLEQNRKDPILRYVSIEAASSLDCLNCSFPMFTYLCSFHQVPPSFLENTFSFGAALSPLDCGLAAFCSEDTLLARDSHTLPVPSLGRSGREIRQAYLLRSVEPSDSVRKWSWGVRQLGVYHSFDVVTGRSTWITVKGNSLMRDRISEAVSTNPSLQPGPRQIDLAESFAATLDIHLLILDWCDENWRWCINDIEKAASRIVNKAKCLNIDSDPDIRDTKLRIMRSSTFNSKTVSRSNTLVESIHSTVGSTVHDVNSFIKRYSFGKAAPFEEKTCEKNPPAPESVPAGETNSRADRMVKLNMFSFKELQELQNIAEKIQEALLVIKLNSAVLAQIKAYYRNLMKTDLVPTLDLLQDKCRHDLASFLSRVEGVEQGLAIRREQLESLLLFVRDGKTLYDGILQYRGVQLNKLYAESAHESSRKMEVIAHKTEEETISMHIITIVTLIFLPGTFIATFFQSGVFQWNEVAAGGAWLFKKDVFGMFATVSVVIMALTFLFWVCLSRMLRRRSRKRLAMQDWNAADPATMV